MKEIARLAGVSIGTVDRVLHQRGRVSAENVARIQAIVEERGYRPNVFASRLSAGTFVRTIGVLVPPGDQDYGYWGLIRQGMERARQELLPLHVEVLFTEFDRGDPASLEYALARLSSEHHAVALPPLYPRIVKPFVESLTGQTPLVFYDTDLDCLHSRSFVGQDPWQGGLLAGRLLGLSLDPGKPVVLVRFDGEDEHLEKRCQGFEAYARTTNRPVLVLNQSTTASADQRRRDLHAFLNAHPSAGGFFVPNASVGEYASAGVGRRVVGYDLVPGNLQALRDGRIDFLLNQRPEIMGYEAVRRLGRNLLFCEALPEKTGLPLDVILKENLEAYLEALEA